MHATIGNKRQRKCLPSLQTTMESIPPTSTRSYNATNPASVFHETKVLESISIPPFPQRFTEMYPAADMMMNNASRTVGSRGSLPHFSSNPMPYTTNSRLLFDYYPKTLNNPHAPPPNSSTSWYYNPHPSLSRLRPQQTSNGEPPILQHSFTSHGEKKVTYTIGPSLCKETNSRSSLNQVPKPGTTMSFGNTCQHMNICEECRNKKTTQYRSVGTMTCDFEDPIEAFAKNIFQPSAQSADPLHLDFHSVDADSETPCSLSKLFTFDDTSCGPAHESTGDAFDSTSSSHRAQQIWSVDPHPTDNLPFFGTSQKPSDLPIALQITDTISSSEESDQQHDWASPSNSMVNSEVTEGTSTSTDNRLNRKLRPRRRCTVQGCGNRVVQGGLCISHGAKRKPCGFTGCPKFVKNAGMCSAHGPRRKRCLVHGCEKASVQNGTCIAHGAKKKLCVMEGCERQGVVKGMCKRHWAEGKNTIWTVCQPCHPSTT
jgi:hypothetical protein